MAAKENTDSDKSDQRSILLDIPPRLQWENGHGYCGETAIQSFGMQNNSFRLSSCENV